MQSTKKKVIDLIEKLPNDVGYDDIFEAIHYQQKIERGIAQSKEKKGIPHDEIRKRFAKADFQDLEEKILSLIKKNPGIKTSEILDIIEGDSWTILEIK